MKAWIEIVLLACAAAVVAAQWMVDPVPGRIAAALLLILVTLIVVAQRRTLSATIGSLRTAHREQIESEHRYRALFDACSDVIVAYPIEAEGRPGAFTEVNEAACATLGFARERLLAMDFERICALEVRRDVRRLLQALGRSGSLVFETVLVTSRDRLLPVEVNASVVVIHGRKLCFAVVRDVTARKEREDRLRGMSHHDELTGLLNRRGFFSAIDDVARRARQRGSLALLTYVDVDGLKRVNDQMGHAAGDQVLRTAADVLRDTFRENDVVARMGGDEFVAVAVLGHPDDERLDQETIMGRFESAVSSRREELGEAYDFSLSCGTLVVTGDDLTRIDELLARTDQRMYETKRARRFAAAS